MKLSIIIPVYNESRTVEELIEKVLEVELPYGLSKEIIVVNDGSTDKTAEKISKVWNKVRRTKRYKKVEFKVLKHDKNLGKGSAVKLGILQSSGDLLIIQDADLEYDPSYFTALIKPLYISKAKVVYGTRLKDYPLKLWGKDKTPLPSHWLGNKMLTFLTNTFYGSKLTDMETCYKLFSREVVGNLSLNSRRFEIEPEITAKILKSGIEIVEVSIKTKPRTKKDGKKIGWTDGFTAVWTLIKYRFID